MAQLAANAAEIAALKAEKEALSRRVVKLEEELALQSCIALPRAAKSTLTVSSTRPKRLRSTARKAMLSSFQTPACQR
ncbi:transposase family protein (plasmid) [Rhizobium grahamii CCGE 502]|uniref:Transposase family protein n=1 Tax=Rhizobium grahamii CCGE 502 TaxID=990285 RepID=S3HKB5_9HYPH|nr:transposase family protein [Rhizobium grahamii CCGE 502]